MTTVQHVISLMEQLAPRSYAESWDNVGLMIGDRNAVVTGVLTTLDVTEEAIAYAIEHNYNLIVSHHPLIFKGLKQLSCDTVQGRMINQLIQNKIAVYSAHTNLDIAPGGLNDMLANQLGLVDIKGFVKTGEDALYKVTTFVLMQFVMLWGPQGREKLVTMSIAALVFTGKVASLAMKSLILSSVKRVL